MAILHRTRTLSALVPRYVTRFRCIGAACEDTCCASWTIHIDKKTYKAYRQNTTPGLREVLAVNLVCQPDAASRTYATIRPTGKALQCPLVEDGLCSVHKHMGETHLSDVCFTYPRQTHRFNGQLEQTLTLSCPEAARQALLAEDAFEFVEDTVTVRDAAVGATSALAPMPPAWMSEVRIFCMNLLRTRELALWQRLAILGTFCAALSRLCAEGRQDGIPQLIDDIVRVVENGELLANLESTRPDHAGQAMVFSLLWSARGFDSPSPFQQNVIGQISAGLGANVHGQASADALVAAYMRGLGRLDEAVREAPYFLENYLANEMFSRLFPFERSDPYESYLRLIARFGLLRFLLAAQCNAEALPSLPTLIATVHLHCRRFQHDQAYTDAIDQALQDSGWARLDKLGSLIRA
jgi:lysine-N-methylase